MATPGTAVDLAVRSETSARFHSKQEAPMSNQDLNRHSVAQRLRRQAFMLAGALLVVAGLILMAAPDLG